jgi:hypothetical protein
MSIRGRGWHAMLPPHSTLEHAFTHGGESWVMPPSSSCFINQTLTKT